jgi:hypothetical protein
MADGHADFSTMNADAAADLERHLATRSAARDAKWRHRLYDLVDDVRFGQRDPRIVPGEDGFPYYRLDVPPAGGPPGTIALGALVELATSSGFGVAIGSRRCDPWLFTCGDLVTRRAFGTYEFPRIGIAPGSGPVTRAVRKESTDVSIGAPPATLLPGYVQPVLRRYFMQGLGIPKPGVLAMHSAGQEPPEQLVFRLSRADFPDEGTFAVALAGVAWFLPRHVIVSVLPPEAVAGLERAFVPLLG